MDLVTVIGTAAAFLTTMSHFFQLRKCWITGSAGDLSLKMFAILATGIALWMAYGIFKQDLLITVANAISLVALAGILYFKLREQKES